MRTYVLRSTGGTTSEITELDLRYVLGQVKNDLKYLRRRGAGRTSAGGDANAARIKSRQQLADKLERMLEGDKCQRIAQERGTLRRGSSATTQDSRTSRR